MYTAVLMIAMTASTDSVDFGRRRCNGCAGAYAGCCARSYSGCAGCSGAYRSGYYAPGYSYSTGGYYYSPNGTVAQAPAGQIRQSFYPSVNQNAAMVRVLLPDANAQIWFDGTVTTQQGMDRFFHSPALESGSTYSYTIKARWLENGRQIDRERSVRLEPGQPITVDFRANPGENLNAPKGPQNPSVPKSLNKDSLP